MGDGQSLLNYNKTLADKHDLGRPPITTGQNGSTPNTDINGWRGTTNAPNFNIGNLINGAAGLNLSGSQNISDGATSAEKWQKAITIGSLGMTGLMAGASIFGGIKSMVDNNKAAKNQAKEDAAENYNPENKATMMDACNLADSFDEKSDLNQMMSTSTSLTQQIQLATDAKNKASQNATQATADKAKYEKALPGAKAALLKFDTDKATAEKDLTDLKAVDTSKMTPEEKVAHNNKITALENKITTEFSDEKRKPLVDSVKLNEDGIKNETKKFDDNTTLAKQLDGEIALAQKSLNKLDKKITNHKDNKD